MDSSPARRRLRRLPTLSFELRILLLALAVGLPATAAALLLLWLGPYSDRVRWIFSSVLLFLCSALAGDGVKRVVREHQLLTNLPQPVRQGDFSQRARPPSPSTEGETLDALGQIML